MEILKSTVNLSLNHENLELKRVEYSTGVIDWITLPNRVEYQLKDGNWYIFDEKAWKYVPWTESTPTWEKEYQDLLLVQYPFEKRVREAMKNKTTAHEVIFKLARDYDFLIAIKNYLEKLRR